MVADSDVKRAGADAFARIFGPASLVYLFISITHLYIVGYSYANVYYERFGLHLHEIGISTLETVEFSTHLFRPGHIRLMLSSMVIIISFTLFLSWWHHISSASSKDRSASGTDKRRKRDSKIIFHCTLAFVPFVFIYFSLLIGSSMANQSATEIINGESGRTAYCTLKEDKYPSINSIDEEDVPLPEAADRREAEGEDHEPVHEPERGRGPTEEEREKSFKETFEEATGKHRVIKIKETEKMVYLFVTPNHQHEDSDHGHSLSFHKSDISYCNVAGVRSDPFL